MNKLLRRTLIGAAALVGLLAVMITVFALTFDINHYKPRIEAAVSSATGMDFKIQGRGSLKIFPRIHIVLNDVHLGHGKADLVSTNEIGIFPRLLPFLLHREITVDQVLLTSPKIRIEKDARGKMNYESGTAAKGSAGRKESGAPTTGQIHSVRIKDGEASYTDSETGKKVLIQGVDANISQINWNSQDFMRSATFRGNILARSLKANTLSATDFKANFQNNQGLIHLDPTEMNAFGGTVKGNAEIDLRSGTPKLKIAQTASHIDLKQALPIGKMGASGIAEVTLNLTALGKSSQAIKKTLSGEVSVHGQNITLTGANIDELAGKLKTAQGLDLVKIGSALLPTQPQKQAAGIAGEASKSKSVIQKLVADWRIQKGIAEAKDVALATEKTTVAFKGKLNLINATYQNFEIATVDSKGCSKNKLEVAGPLNRPRPVIGSVGKQISSSFLGDAGSAMGSAGSTVAGIFGSKDKSKPENTSPTPSGCDRFYSGTLMG